MEGLFKTMICQPKSTRSPVKPRGEIQIVLIFLAPEGIGKTISNVKNVTKKKTRETLQVMV